MCGRDALPAFASRARLTYGYSFLISVASVSSITTAKIDIPK